MIIVMDKGNLKYAGTLSCFLLSPFSMMSASEASGDSSRKDTERSLVDCEEMKSYNQPQSDCTSLPKEDIEARKEGRVEFSVYK